MNIDQEFLETKLKDYTLIEDLSNIMSGDHIRYTSARYQEEGRKCAYVIVKSIDDGVLTVNGYKSTYSDWKVDPLSKFKEYKFYKKIQPVYTGECAKCEIFVCAPYITCYKCR
jgi:hypothetical protein